MTDLTMAALHKVQADLNAQREEGYTLTSILEGIMEEVMDDAMDEYEKSGYFSAEGAMYNYEQRKKAYFADDETSREGV